MTSSHSKSAGRIGIKYAQLMYSNKLELFIVIFIIPQPFSRGASRRGCHRKLFIEFSFERHQKLREHFCERTLGKFVVARVFWERKTQHFDLQWKLNFLFEWEKEKRWTVEALGFKNYFRPHLQKFCLFCSVNNFSSAELNSVKDFFCCLCKWI